MTSPCRLTRLDAAATLAVLVCLFATAPAVAQSTGNPSTGNQSAADASGTASSPPPATGLWDRDTLTSGNWGGLGAVLQESGIKFGLQEQDELWGNVGGGIRQGATYNGLTTASVTINLEKAVGWTGANFFASAFQIHGRQPTNNLVGNLQTVSNIEATRATKLYDLWIEQTLFDGKLAVRVGQEGANDELMVTQYGAVLINSSFGYPALAALDLPSGGPNYPIATPVVRLKYQPYDTISFMSAVFNGDPAGPGPGDPQLRDASGTAFRVNDSPLLFEELAITRNQAADAKGLPATYKVGAWFHTGTFADLQTDTLGRSLAAPNSSGVPHRHRDDYALYAVMDQLVWREPGHSGNGIGVFALAMGAPASRNIVSLDIEAGLNWKGMFPGRDDDVFAFGVSYAGISRAEQARQAAAIAFTGSGQRVLSNETVLEATYTDQVAPWLVLQPDLQYVINPGAGLPTNLNPVTSRALKNATVIGLRSTLTF
jgi:porin